MSGLKPAHDAFECFVEGSRPRSAHRLDRSKPEEQKQDDGRRFDPEDGSDNQCRQGLWPAVAATPFVVRAPLEQIQFKARSWPRLG
jgi:hypothetical protein